MYEPIFHYGSYYSGWEIAINSCIPCFQYTCLITKSFADHIIGRNQLTEYYK